MGDDASFGRAAGAGVARPPWVLVLCLMALFAYSFVDRVVLALMVEPIRLELGISDVQISVLLGLAFAAFYAALNLPAGYLVDRFNRRVLIGGACVVWAAMTLFTGLAHTFVTLIMARAGVGMAEAIILPAAFSLIRDATAPRARAAAFSVFAMAPMLGTAVALAAGGVLLHAAKAHALPLVGALTPWRQVMVTMGIAGAPLSLLLLLFKEPVRDFEDAADAGQDLRSVFAHVRQNLGAYLFLIAFVTFGAMMAFGENAWLPALFGRRFSLPPEKVGPMLGGIVLVCGLTGLSFSAWVSTRIERRGGDIRAFGAIAGAGTALGMAGAALAPGLGPSLACAAVGLFFVGVSFPIGATTLAQIAPTQVMGRISGFYLLFQTLVGQSLGPMIIAFGSEKVFGGGRTGLAPAFAVTTLTLGVATVACALMLRRGMRRRGAAALTVAVQA